MNTGIRQRARSSLAFGLVLAFVPALAEQSKPTVVGDGFHRHFAEEPHMGVVVRIEAFVPTGTNPARVFRSAFDRVSALTKVFSSYRDDSELSDVEQRAWESPVRVSPEFATVLSEALRIARQSGGAFDPTVGRVTRLLRNRPYDRRGPGEREISNAWDLTGWRQVTLDSARRLVFLRMRGLQFDFGGIAKGYIADQVIETLETEGVSRAIVSVAGDIVAGDPPPGERGWQVALDATGEPRTVERTLLVRNQAVSTSGSRERYHFAGGRRCSHVVTRKSSPCADVRQAVSVVAPTGLEADGLATALLALGRARSGPILSARLEVQAYWAETAAEIPVPAAEARERR